MSTVMYIINKFYGLKNNVWFLDIKFAYTVSSKHFFRSPLVISGNCFVYM